MCSHSLMPAVIPGNSSKCTLKTQQLFQITAMKMTLAAALPQLGKWSHPAGSFLTWTRHQNSSLRGSLHVCVSPPAHRPVICSESKAEWPKIAGLIPQHDPRSPYGERPLKRNCEWTPSSQIESIREMPKIRNHKGSKVRSEFRSCDGQCSMCPTPMPCYSP